MKTFRQLLWPIAKWITIWSMAIDNIVSQKQWWSKMLIGNLKVGNQKFDDGKCGDQKFNDKKCGDWKLW